jgi:hypothetical protein
MVESVRTVAGRCLVPGQTLVGVESAVCVIVLSGSQLCHELRCDGELLLLGRPYACSQRPQRANHALSTGAVYRDDRTSVEVRCTAANGDVLTLDGRRMRVVVAARQAASKGAVSKTGSVASGLGSQ